MAKKTQKPENLNGKCSNLYVALSCFEENKKDDEGIFLSQMIEKNQESRLKKQAHRDYCSKVSKLHLEVFLDTDYGDQGDIL